LSGSTANVYIEEGTVGDICKIYAVLLACIRNRTNPKLNFKSLLLSFQCVPRMFDYYNYRVFLKFLFIFEHNFKIVVISPIFMFRFIQNRHLSVISKMFVIVVTIVQAPRDFMCKIDSTQPKRNVAPLFYYRKC
jgi:hypothetical protein